MGTDKLIRCNGCEEYAHLDKVPFVPYWSNVDTEEWFNAPNYRYQTMKLIAFINEHEGHNLQYVTEHYYGGDMYLDAALRWTEFDINQQFKDVKSECDWSND